MYIVVISNNNIWSASQGHSSNDSPAILPADAGTGLVWWQDVTDPSRRHKGALHSLVLTSTKALWKAHTAGTQQERNTHCSLSKAAAGTSSDLGCAAQQEEEILHTASVLAPLMGWAHMMTLWRYLSEQNILTASFAHWKKKVFAKDLMRSD